MTDRTVKVKIVGDTGQYESAMGRASKATSEMDQAAEQAQKRASMWKTIGMVGQVAGAAIAVGLYKSVQAASAQEQAMGSLEAVFQSSFGTMQKYAENANEIGLSQRAYAENASLLGAQLANLGISQDQLASKTNTMIGYAADMAAMFGGTTQQAVEALTAAFRGERDPIERYGVSLNETNVKAEMAATGLSKVEATAALVAKQLAKNNVIGASAREYDTFAAASQRMSGAIEDLQAELGAAFLPALSKGAEAAAQFAKAINSLPGPVKAVLAWFTALSAGALLLAPKIVSMAQSLRQMGYDMSGLARNGAAVAKTLSVVGVAGFAAEQGIDALNKGVLVLAGHQAQLEPEKLEQQMNAWATAADGVLPPLGGIGDGLVNVSELAGRMDDNWFQGLMTVAKEGPIAAAALDEFKSQMQAIDGVMQSWIMSGTEGEEKARALAERMFEAFGRDNYGSFEEFVMATLPEAASALGITAEGTDEAAAAANRHAAAVEKEKQAVSTLIGDLNTLIGIQLAMIGSSDALVGMQGRFSDAIKENGRALRGNSAAAVANREVMSAEMNKILALGKAKYDQVVKNTGDENRALAAQNRVIAGQAQAFREAARAAGFSAKDVNLFLQALGLIPKEKKVEVSAKGVKDSQKNVRALRDEVDKTPDKKSVKVSTNAPDTTKKLKLTKDQVDSLNKRRAHILTSTTAPKTEKQLKSAEGQAKSLNKQNPNVSTKTNAPDTTKKLKDTEVQAKDTDRASSHVETSTNAPTTTTSINSLAQAVRNIPTYHNIEIHYQKTGDSSGGGGGGSWATGGEIRGAGTGTSDSILAWVSNGEYVQRSRAVAKYGVKFMDALNAGLINPDDLPTFKTGGSPDRFFSKKRYKKYQRKQAGSESRMSDYFGWDDSFMDFLDPRWVDYNPTPGIKDPPKNLKIPARKKNEKLKEYEQRVKEWKQNQKARFKEWNKTRQQTENEWRRTIAAERRDDKWGKFDDAVELYQKIRDERLAFEESIKSNLISSLSAKDAFDWDGETDAVNRRVDAEKALYEARVRLNTASPADEAEALRAVRDAQLELNDARAAEAKAAPTAQNIVASFEDRAKRAFMFTAGIKELAARGLHNSILQEILSSGVDEGLQMITALKGLDDTALGRVSQSQYNVEKIGEHLSQWAGQRQYGAFEAMALGSVYANAPTAMNVQITGSQPIVLKVDAKTIAAANLKLQRQSGGTYAWAA